MDMVTVRVWAGDEEHVLQVAPGTNLREALLANDLSPYAAFTRYTNCGGRGLCATCGVRLGEETLPVHWHDRLAQRFGYPRLSCQITVEQDITVYLDEEKLIWGGRRHAGQEPPEAP